MPPADLTQFLVPRVTIASRWAACTSAFCGSNFLTRRLQAVVTFHKAHDVGGLPEVFNESAKVAVDRLRIGDLQRGETRHVEWALLLSNTLERLPDFGVVHRDQATNRLDHNLKDIESLSSLGYRRFLSKAPLSDPRPIAPCVCKDEMFCSVTINRSVNVWTWSVSITTC